jgi:isopropylmalate/homocitrate/citramalate synthase
MRSARRLVCRKKDPELMDAVYSGVPAQMVGRAQQIEVGPLSGKSNVVFWLEQHGFAPAEHVVDRVFHRAKSSRQVLTEQEILDEIHVAQTYATTRLDA